MIGVWRRSCVVKPRSKVVIYVLILAGLLKCVKKQGCRGRWSVSTPAQMTLRQRMGVLQIPSPHPKQGHETHLGHSQSIYKYGWVASQYSLQEIGPSSNVKCSICTNQLCEKPHFYIVTKIVFGQKDAPLFLVSYNVDIWRIKKHFKNTYDSFWSI